MKFISTRGNSFYSLDEALLQGIAGDGGLFIPDRLPKFLTNDYKSADTINQIAKVFLEPFFKNSILYETFDQIIEESMMNFLSYIMVQQLHLKISELVFLLHVYLKLKMKSLSLLLY